jgi:hypothetical protein
MVLSINEIISKYKLGYSTVYLSKLNNCSRNTIARLLLENNMLLRSRPTKLKKELHPNWKGGVMNTSHGYKKILSPNHPNKDYNGYVPEHRLVIENSLGRFLTKDEYVHHKNGNKKDNRLDNLEIVLEKKHYGNIRCPHCLKEFLIR